MHKPAQSLIFGLLTFFMLGLLSLIFPEKGLTFGWGLKLDFPSPDKLLADNSEKKSEVEKIIESVTSLDTVIPAIASASLKPEITKVRSEKYSASVTYRNRDALKKFFDALSDVARSRTPVRILHYGDSQIEGDRITEYLRSKYQAQFGGHGPGLLSFLPVAPRPDARISATGKWENYGVFVAKDKRVKHSNFGVLACFNRFSPYRKVSDTTAAVFSSVTINAGGNASGAYDKVKLFYGGAGKKTWCEFYDGPALIGADSLAAGGDFNLIEFEVGRGSSVHSFRFSGKDSPDFYAVSLESDGGVIADNIALRGSSGTFFYQINGSQLKQFYDHLNAKLIILQFGGNALPAIDNEETAHNYGNYIKYQLSVLRKLAPGASILFVGPSDMSIKEGTEYVSRPFIEETRNAIREAVLESGCAFFDMYESMGGKNSMPVWVEQKLAATDYTHFSPKGARKIATLLYAALNKEYLSYQESMNLN